MGISLATLRAPIKHWSSTVTIGGVPYTAVERLPNRAMGFNQKRNTCSAIISEYPNCQAGDPIVVTLTVNVETEVFFVGQVDQRPIADLPLSYEVNAVDLLSKLDRPVTKEITWRNTSVAAAVRELLRQAGLADNQIGQIYDPGAAFVLGPVYKIVIAKGTSISELLTKLGAFAGISIEVQPDGLISCINERVFPAASSDFVYAYGADPDQGEFGLYRARRTLGGVSDRVYRFTATGPKRPDLQIPDATFTLAGVSGREENETYQYIQTNAAAEAVARREIVKRNRISTEVAVEAPLNPLLRPGDTVFFRDPDLGFAANTPSVVLGISTNDDTMTMTLSVGAKPPDGSLTFIPPPKADFDYEVERQPVKLAGQMSTNIVVSCRSRASDPNGLPITSLKWTASCAGSVEPAEVTWQPTSGDTTGQNPIFIFSTFEDASILLEVESQSGEGARSQQTIDPGEASIFTRKLGTATLEGWRVLASEVGWRSYSSNATAVPNINDLGPFLAGFADGKIYLTEDDLATEPIFLATVEGPVNNLYVDEVDGTTLTAGHASKVSQSQDAGYTWVSLHGFEDACVYAEHEAGNPQVVRACSGKNLWITYTRGATWTASITGPDGSLCRKFARATWGCGAVFSGDIPPDQAFWIEGAGAAPIAWGEFPVPIGGLTCICPLLNEPGWLVGTGGINDIVRDGLMPELAYAAAMGAGSVYKVVQDGSGWKATSRAQIESPGTYKVVHSGVAFSIDIGTTGTLRIGYGGTAEPPKPPEILFIANTETGDNQLWHYKTDGTGWTPILLPSYGQGRWLGLVVNPAIRTQWLLWDQDRLFFTIDSGVTWNQVPIATGTGLLTSFSTGVVSAAFTGVGSNWVYAKHFAAWSGSQRADSGYIAHGVGPRVVEYKSFGALFGKTYPPIKVGKDNGEGFHSFTGLITGYGGEVVATGSTHSTGAGIQPQTDQVFVIRPPLTIEAGKDAYFWTPQDTLNESSRQLVATQFQNVGYTNNYKQEPVAVTAAGTTAVSVAAGVFAAGDNGIVQIVGFANANPQPQVVAGAGRPVQGLVRGARRRGMAAWAALTGDGAPAQIVFFNGEQWGVVNPPTVSSNPPMLAVVEL